MTSSKNLVLALIGSIFSATQFVHFFACRDKLTPQHWTCYNQYNSPKSRSTESFLVRQRGWVKGSLVSSGVTLLLTSFPWPCMIFFRKEKQGEQYDKAIIFHFFSLSEPIVRVWIYRRLSIYYDGGAFQDELCIASSLVVAAPMSSFVFMATVLFRGGIHSGLSIPGFFFGRCFLAGFPRPP